MSPSSLPAGSPGSPAASNSTDAPLVYPMNLPCATASVTKSRAAGRAARARAAPGGTGLGEHGYRVVEHGRRAVDLLARGRLPGRSWRKRGQFRGSEMISRIPAGQRTASGAKHRANYPEPPLP